MRMTPRLLAAATAAFVPVAHIPSLSRAFYLVHGVPASVIDPARQLPSVSHPWSFPCVSLPSTASMPTA